MTYFLPEGYTPRTEHEFYLDIPGEWIYQPYVYELAHFLAKRGGARTIIDIGCGSGGKLKSISKMYQIVGIDSSAGISLAQAALPNARLIEHDLELGLPNLPLDLVRDSIIICSDVIEHLKRPENLMSALAKLSDVCSYMLISTPDRDRARGWLDYGPPANPAHVMEWGASEFVRFMCDCGFKDIPFYGHTINTNFHRAKSTLLTISGQQALYTKPTATVSVAAIIHTYNEVDIIVEVVDHLLTQGVEVHIFDNWSTDGTWEIVSQLFREGKVAHIERYPFSPSPNYEWRSQLQKTEEYALTLKADWVMHHDADEIRISPWPGVTLNDAISYVDHLGYNSIDFTVIDFRFLKEWPDCTSNYQERLTHFDFGRRPGHFSQIKAWKNQSLVDLANSGGHEAIFPERKVYPFKFLLKHYPLRNRGQAEKKIFHDRLPRFEVEQKKFGWHNQYTQFAVGEEIEGWDLAGLIPWHARLFQTEYLVERLSGIGLTVQGM